MSELKVVRSAQSLKCLGRAVQREGTATEKALSSQVRCVWSCVVERGGLHRFRYEKCKLSADMFLFHKTNQRIRRRQEKTSLFQCCEFKPFFNCLYKTVIMQRCKSQLAAIHLHGLPLPAELEVSCFLMVFEIISERMSLWRIAKLIQKSCGKSFLSAWLAPAVLKYLPAGFGEKLTIIVPMDVSRLLKGCSFTWEQCVCVCARGREFTVNWWISECVNILYYMTV